MPLPISVATGENVQALLEQVGRLLDSVRRRDPGGWAEGGLLSPAEGEDVQASVPVLAVEPNGDLPVVRPREQRRFTIQRLNEGHFTVEGRRLEAMAEMLNLSQDEARAEFLRRLTRFGVAAALRRAGVHNGDRVRFGPTEITWDFD